MQIFSLIDHSYFFVPQWKITCLFLKKIYCFPETGILSKNIKISKDFNSAEFIAFLWHFTHVSPWAMPTEKC